MTGLTPVQSRCWNLADSALESLTWQLWWGSKRFGGVRNQIRNQVLYWTCRMLRIQTDMFKHRTRANLWTTARCRYRLCGVAPVRRWDVSEFPVRIFQDYQESCHVTANSIWLTWLFKQIHNVPAGDWPLDDGLLEKNENREANERKKEKQ